MGNGIRALYRETARHTAVDVLRWTMRSNTEFSNTVENAHQCSSRFPMDNVHHIFRGTYPRFRGDSLLATYTKFTARCCSFADASRIQCGRCRVGVDGIVSIAPGIIEQVN